VAVDRAVVLVHGSMMDRAKGYLLIRSEPRPRVIERPWWPASKVAAASAPETETRGGAAALH
jgi:hypothetical protein